MLIEKLALYRIGTGGDSTKTVTIDELTAIVLWLVGAYYNKEMSPLTLRGQTFCWRDGYVIKFVDQNEAMSMETLYQLLLDIDNTSRLDKGFITYMFPVLYDWHECTPISTFRVKTVDGLLNYYDQHDEAVLPVALRHSEDWKHWYAVKQTDQYEGKKIFVTRYKFDNLSLGQL